MHIKEPGVGSGAGWWSWFSQVEVLSLRNTKSSLEEIINIQCKLCNILSELSESASPKYDWYLVNCKYLKGQMFVWSHHRNQDGGHTAITSKMASGPLGIPPSNLLLILSSNKPWSLHPIIVQWFTFSLFLYESNNKMCILLSYFSLIVPGSGSCAIWYVNCHSFPCITNANIPGSSHQPAYCAILLLLILRHFR